MAVGAVKQVNEAPACNRSNLFGGMQSEPMVKAKSRRTCAATASHGVVNEI